MTLLISTPPWSKQIGYPIENPEDTLTAPEPNVRVVVESLRDCDDLTNRSTMMNSCLLY